MLGAKNIGLTGILEAACCHRYKTLFFVTDSGVK
jgi:hypothetical protein